MKIKSNLKNTIKYTAFVAMFLFNSCQMSATQRDFNFAEELWLGGEYQKAVEHFVAIYENKPNSELGIQSLLRAATTETLFLKKHGNAIDKLNTVSKLSEDVKTKHYVYLKIGDILYLHLKDYKKTINHYYSKVNDLKNEDKRDAYFRMAKSSFHLMKFKQAKIFFEKIISEFPREPLAERAFYETGLTLFSSASVLKEKYNQEHVKIFQQTIERFKKFIKTYPESKKISEAYFGIASSYEELGDFQKAFQLFQKIEKEYRSQKVIQIKLSRLQKRMELVN